MSSDGSATPARVVRCEAPVRILDNGGWTDTWFARHGRVFNVAISPAAGVQVEGAPGKPAVTVIAMNYGDEYTFIPGGPGRGRHPLLEAAIEYAGVPEETALRISIGCSVPTGASTGTSSAILVALLAAMKSYREESWTPHDIAYEAHHVEMDILQHQCGIQDHIASAYGGVNFIDITDFPSATVTQLRLEDVFRAELERQILLVYLGRSHDSADMHRQVIRRLEDSGPESPEFEDLRVAADHARDAALAGDLRALGAAMIENTEAQTRLHDGLVSRDAQRIIAIGRDHGASGWKVNGAGGEGGTVTLLFPGNDVERHRLVAAFESANRSFRQIPVRLSPTGVRILE